MTQNLFPVSSLSVEDSSLAVTYVPNVAVCHSKTFTNSLLKFLDFEGAKHSPVVGDNICHVI